MAILDGQKHAEILQRQIEKIVNESRCVVRLKTTVYSDRRGLHLKKSITYQKRKSKGYNFLYADAQDNGSADTIDLIDNIMDVPDGLYEVKVTDEIRAYESNEVVDYRYKLTPYVEGE